ncbi:PIN domain-containing protein [Arthrobacter sp. TMN-50]
MIGLDTNVLVRYLVRDDPAQSAAASALIRSFTARQPGYVSMVVLVETFWVLKRAYKLDQRDIARVILDLAASEDVVVEHADIVRRAARSASEGHDFADVLIAFNGELRGCSHTATFDAKAAGLPGMQFLGGV